MTSLITAPPSEPRLLMFSHDTFGLGHLRRCSTLAWACAREIEGLSTLYLTGAGRPHRFGLPGTCDVVTLPALTKNPIGFYEPRHLEVSTDLVMSMRRGLILEAVRRFAPHVVLIDHAPLGAGGELRPMLEWVRDHLPSTRVVLGMRDVLDDPQRVATEFGDESLPQLIESYYDDVLVYGDQRIFDPAIEYGFPAAVAERTRFVGYVSPDIRKRVRARGDRPRILVQAGGGEDGKRLYEAVLDAMAGPLADADVNVDLVVGPYLASEDRKRVLSRASRDPRFRAGGFRRDFASELRGADAVISMAGANSVAEILALGVPAIFAPRQWPRREQFVRANRLEQLGLCRTIDVDKNDVAERLAGLMRLAMDGRLLPSVRLSPSCQGGLGAARYIAGLLSDGGAASARIGEVRHA